jgi:hypothetical protein
MKWISLNIKEVCKRRQIVTALIFETRQNKTKQKKGEKKEKRYKLQSVII